MYSVLKIEEFSDRDIAQGRINGVDITKPKIIGSFDGMYSAYSLARKMTKIHRQVCDQFNKEYYVSYKVERV